MYSLPNADPQPTARSHRLDAARATYTYDRSDRGLLYIADLPRAEQFGARYLAIGTEIRARLAANRAAVEASDFIHGGPGSFVGLYPLLERPLATRVTDEDAAFGWQRLAGPNPAHVRRARADDPGVTALGLADDARAGRIYASDHRWAASCRAGSTDGRNKHLLPAFALFRATESGLAPLAIDVAGELVRVGDGDRWRLARLALQTADENFQGIVAHVGWCHFVIQRFIFAMHRQLDVHHPLYALLAPHFQYTLAVNEVARKSVLNPGGDQDRLLVPVLDDQVRVLTDALASVDLGSLDPEIDAERRGVHDRSLLPVYPFRDDAALHWSALRRFITAAVERVYADDAAVAADAELQGFAAEVGRADGGGLPKLACAPADRAAVVDLLARVLFRATAFHASINDANYDWAGYPPNMPTAAFAELRPGPTTTPADLAAALPSQGLSFEILRATYNVANLKSNRLGEYPPFADPGFEALAAAYRADLATIEAAITERNHARFLPYTFLLPSQMTASINA